MKISVRVLCLFMFFLLSALNIVNAEENATSITVDIVIVVETPAPVAVSTAPPVVVQEVVVVDNSDSIDIVYDGVPEPLEKEPPVIIEDTTIPKPVEEEQTWESFVDTSIPNPIEEERTSSSVTDNTIPLPIEEEKKEEFTSEVVIDNTIPKPVETPRKEESTNSTKVDREEPKPVRDSTSTTDTDRPNPVVNKKDKEKETIVDNSLPKPVDKIENSTLKPIQKDNDGGVQQTVAGSMVNQIGNTGVLPFEEESEFDERVKWEECSHTFYNQSLNTEYLEDSESHHLMITRSERVCRWCGYVTGEIREDVVPSVHIFSHDGICYRCGCKQDGDTQEWKKVSKAVGDVTKVAGAISEACSVLSDYAVQSAKLEVVKEAMGNSSLNHLVEAVEYMENYYNSELARLFDAGTDEAISFAEGKSKVWQTVKNVFKYAPGDVDNVASSCIALVDLEEMVFEMETDLERSLVKVGNGKSEITEDELKKKMHALIDLKILSAELAQNLTWSEYKDDVLSQNVEAMEGWHEQVDGVVEGWYHE